MPRVLITRPALQAQSLLYSLQAQNIEGFSVPLLQIETLTEGPAYQAVRQNILDLDLFDMVIAISVNAAEHFVDWGDQFWPQWPLETSYFAVGEKTAQVLRHEGLEVISPKILSSEGLLALPELQEVSGKKVLLCCGQGGRTAIQDGLSERGAQVQRCEFYRRVLPEQAKEQLALLKNSPCDAIAISSGEALEHLSRLFKSLALLETYQHKPLFVPSERIWQQAQTLGWQQLILADNATDKAVLQAIQSRYNI